MNLPKYTIGVGDRFAHQGKAQLAAFIKARDLGVDVTPVWNKSNREHTIVGSEPASVRAEADAAVKALGWTGPYFVDADHIGLATVERFLVPSDFFTIDVADAIGKPAAEADIAAFAAKHARLAGSLDLPGVEKPLNVSGETIEAIARKYLFAAQSAAAVHRRIESAKGAENFVAEVSMDETDRPQSPVELLFILAALADQNIPVRTIAPKFTGRFNKGVDYVGDLTQFEREFNDDLAVIAFAVREFGLPTDLKLSVHSGSDKFSLYPIIRRTLRKTQAGLHLKTAGTTWLEELIGLASAGGEGLVIAKEVYALAVEHFDELAAPYATVIDIDKGRLPTPADVARWDGDTYATALRHEPKNPFYNPHLRQLLHVAFKIAAKMGGRYVDALKKHEAIVAENVTRNIYERHLKPLFIDAD
jgi:hypothetical protein